MTLTRGEGEQIPDYMLIIAPLPWERDWGEVGRKVVVESLMNGYQINQYYKL